MVRVCRRREGAACFLSPLPRNVGGLRVALAGPAAVAAPVVRAWLLRGRVRRPGVLPTKVGALRRDVAGSASNCSTRRAAGQAGNRAQVAGAGDRHRAGRRAVLAASSAAAVAAAGLPPPRPFGLSPAWPPLPGLLAALALRGLSLCFVHVHVRVLQVVREGVDHQLHVVLLL